MNETPQEKLYAAAQRLDELAERAVKSDPPYDWPKLTGFITDGYTDDELEAGQAWCRALPPQAGQHLALWLRERGDDWYSERRAQSKWPEGGYTMLLPDDFEAAVAFAELILASAS